MTDSEWVVLYGDVKVKRKAIPDVDPEKLLEQVLESALASGFADVVGPLNLRPDENLVKVGTVVALCLALREAKQPATPVKGRHHLYASVPCLAPFNMGSTWACSLEKGHASYHEAREFHVLNNELLARWI